MNKSKLIVLWGDENVLGSSVKHFLSTNENWKVVWVSNKEELDALIQVAERSCVDIVFIHLGCVTDSSNLPMQLLQDHPAIQVIKISLENNTMEVYSKQKISVQKATDLIAVIESSPIAY